MNLTMSAEQRRRYVVGDVQRVTETEAYECWRDPYGLEIGIFRCPDGNCELDHGDLPCDCFCTSLREYAMNVPGEAPHCLFSGQEMLLVEPVGGWRDLHHD